MLAVAFEGSVNQSSRIRMPGPNPTNGWLSGVQAAARTCGGDVNLGSHSVYLLLLLRAGEFGVYVGLTGLTPEKRVENQMSGHKASRAARKYGIRLLRPFFDHLEGIDYYDARRLERELAGLLRRSGYWVEGGH
jgi:hypothetical protein